jgi:hypothetical protein
MGTFIVHMGTFIVHMGTFIVPSVPGLQHCQHLPGRVKIPHGLPCCAVLLLSIPRQRQPAIPRQLGEPVLDVSNSR